jgi:hypothetical protein
MIRTPHPLKIRRPEEMSSAPNTPHGLMKRLGLSLDLSVYLSPAVIGATGKRHYYGHGHNDGRREIMDVLRRLCRMKGL